MTGGNFVERPVDLGFLAHVAMQIMRFAGLADVRRGFLARLVLDIEQDDLCAVLSETGRAGKANASRRPRHHRQLTLETHCPLPN